MSDSDEENEFEPESKVNGMFQIANRVNFIDSIFL